ncbi:hypothetical protein ACFL6B_03295 [Thermodesulfobacteriota bacterium]
MGASLLASEIVAHWQNPNIQQGISNDEESSPYLGYTTASYSTANSIRGHTGCFPSILKIGHSIFNTPVERCRADRGTLYRSNLSGSSARGGGFRVQLKKTLKQVRLWVKNKNMERTKHVDTSHVM